jgi:hypothetical protein
MKYLTTMAIFLVSCSVCIGAGIEPSADIEAKRDIKGYRPGMTLEVVKAKFPNWANCHVIQTPGLDLNRYATYGCPIKPKTWGNTADPVDLPRPYEFMTFITSKTMTPETVLFVLYAWSSNTQDPKALAMAILNRAARVPSTNPLMTELDRDVETIRKEFSVTEYEACSPPQPASPICIWWHLDNGGLLKFFYTMSDDNISLGLTPPTWLQEREKQSYGETLPKKF